VEGDWDGCQAETLGSDFDVERLNRPDFVHRVVVNGEDLGVEVGPGTAGYVPLSQIPPVLQAAMMGTEDLAFYSHRGFKVSLIRRALVLLAERGRYVYGGSTISQQLVKNLFLSREKTLARKFEEALIVWQMERKVPKERILELYINCIEYGPKVWGITAAAQTYFGKPPSQLSTLEAAFLAGLKPDPAYGYLQYTRGKLNKHWRKFLDHVLDRLLEMKSISQEEHDRCLKQELAFAASGAPLVALPPVGPGEDDRPVKQGQEQEEL
jgi:membrane peptidoglycan carboxypeptidase